MTAKSRSAESSSRYQVFPRRVRKTRPPDSSHQLLPWQKPKRLKNSPLVYHNWPLLSNCVISVPQIKDRTRDENRRVCPKDDADKKCEDKIKNRLPSEQKERGEDEDQGRRSVDRARKSRSH